MRRRKRTGSLDPGEEVFTFAEPNKIIYIEREALPQFLLSSRRATASTSRISSFPSSRIRSWPRPRIPSISSRSTTSSTSSAKRTQEDVEFTLLNSPEFAKSENKKGVFTYHEPYVPKEGAPLESAFPKNLRRTRGRAITPRGSGPRSRGRRAAGRRGRRGRGPQGASEGAHSPTRPRRHPEESKGLQEKEADYRGREGPGPEEKRTPRHRREARRGRIGPGSPGRRQGKEEEGLEQRAKEKKEEFKPAPKEQPKFGIFGDLLKTALKKKDDKKPEDETK